MHNSTDAIRCTAAWTARYLQLHWIHTMLEQPQMHLRHIQRCSAWCTAAWVSRRSESAVLLWCIAEIGFTWCTELWAPCASRDAHGYTLYMPHVKCKMPSTVTLCVTSQSCRMLNLAVRIVTRHVLRQSILGRTNIGIIQKRFHVMQLSGGVTLFEAITSYWPQPSLNTTYMTMLGKLLWWWIMRSNSSSNCSFSVDKHTVPQPTVLLLNSHEW